MIFGIGTDLIEVDRVKEKLLKTPGLKEEIFTDVEINYCESKRYKYRHYAVRFAAKEAFFKALGTGWKYGMKFRDVEVRHDDDGRPLLLIHGQTQYWFEDKKLKDIHLSLTHLNELVNAVVIIEK